MCALHGGLNNLYLATVTNDRSEARVDPLAALLVQGQQANIKQGYRGQRRQGRVEIRSRAMGQGRRQTERITSKQARLERQAANDQEWKSTVQGNTRKDKLGKTLGNVSQGKNKTSHWVSVLCAAFM